MDLIFNCQSSIVNCKLNLKSGVKKMKITVYGPGCSNCEKLANNAKQAAKDLGIDVELEKVEDVNEMTKAGVMRTPGLAIDGQLKVSGKVADVDKIKELLS